MSMPSNHRLAERQLIRLVQVGRWEIDAHGRVWVRKLWTGRVISVPRRAEQNAGAYLLVRATLNGKRVCGCAHRLVWQHFNGDIPEGLIINHINGSKKDNRPSNLEVTSYSENSLHASRVLDAYRDQSGERNHMAQLTRAKVIDMRVARARGATLKELSERFGCAEQTASKIVRGERWAHIGGPITRVRQWPEVRHG